MKCKMFKKLTTKETGKPAIKKQNKKSEDINTKTEIVDGFIKKKPVTKTKTPLIIVTV